MRDDENIVGWFSLENGQHVPIHKGESKREAVQKAINKRMSRVERNKDKYDKVAKFTKQKKSNNKIKQKNDNDQEFGKKLIGLKRNGNEYYPIREGEKESKEYTDTRKQKQDEVYERIASKHEDDYMSRAQHKEKEYVYITDKETDDEIRQQLDKYVENGETITKEDVRRIVENFKSKKATNVAKPKINNNMTMQEKLQLENDYLEKQIKEVERGNIFIMREGKTALLKNTNLMTSKEYERWQELLDRQYIVRNQLRELKKKS